jgi:hypothetical protein
VDGASEWQIFSRIVFSKRLNGCAKPTERAETGAVPDIQHHRDQINLRV